MTEAAFWFVQSVQAQPYLGTGSRGPEYGPPVDVPCWLDEGSHLIRDSKGDEVTSMAVVAAAVDAPLTLGTLVTLPSERVAEVLAVSVAVSGSLDLGLDHVEAHLT